MADFMLDALVLCHLDGVDSDQPHGYYSTRSGGRARPGYASLFYSSSEESDVGAW